MDDLNPYEQSVCEFLDNLGVIFETPKILTREYRASDLKKYIGIVFGPGLVSFGAGFFYCLCGLLVS